MNAYDKVALNLQRSTGLPDAGVTSWPLVPASGGNVSPLPHPVRHQIREQARRLRELIRQMPGSMYIVPSHERVIAFTNELYPRLAGIRAVLDELLLEALALAVEMAERTWAVVGRICAEAVTAIRSSDERYRMLFASLNEGFATGEVIYGANGCAVDYRFIECNPAFERLTGLANSARKGVGESVPDRASDWVRGLAPVLENGKPLRLERRNVAGDRWLEINISRLGGESSGRVAMVLTEITRRKQAEQHRELLIRELNHRVKNTLTTVQSLAMQSLHNADSAEAGRAVFDARLLALSKAHDVLTSEHWEFADLGKIVAGSIAPYSMPDRASRFDVEGDSLRLRPQAGLAVAMALHELATNAVKYGALSNEDGQVRIRWEQPRGDEDGRAVFRLLWTESGGPPVTPPERRGFGSRLVEQGLAQDLGGTVKLRFEPSGLVCEIAAPLDGIIARATEQPKL